MCKVFGTLGKLSDTSLSGFMRMNVAQEADIAASANKLVKMFGPTGLKAHHGTEERPEYTNKVACASYSGES